jgi:uncharacterized protein YjdB
VTTAPAAITAVVLSESSLKLGYGASGSVRYSFEPDSATGGVSAWTDVDGVVSLTVSPGVVSVKALKAGRATVTVSAENGVSAVFRVLVED